MKNFSCLVLKNVKGCTIAGIAMKIFRHMFLPKKHVGIVPEFGYERNDRASDIAIKYLQWRAKKEQVKIKHAGNGREKEILTIEPSGKTYRYKVDGYIEDEDRTIEFLGNFLFLFKFYICFRLLFSRMSKTHSSRFCWSKWKTKPNKL